MNGLLAKSKFGSQLGERLPILEYVYGIIDSKIDYVELKARHILDRFKNLETREFSNHYHYLESVKVSEGVSLQSDNDQIFSHLEYFSRSIYVLEQMKLSLNEDNAFSVIQLLNDDNYLKINESQLGELLNRKSAA